jgi:PKHD-type hydroxylase
MDKSDILSTKNGLTNYFYFSAVLNDDEINRVKELAKKYNVIEANISGNIDKTYRSSQIRWIPYNDDSKWLYEKCKRLLIKANTNMWNFNTTNIKEALQFTEYRADVEGHYDWHSDLGDLNSTRKISMSIQLSDPSDYFGGELEFMTGRLPIKAPKTKGTVIFFPSYLMHRVTKVTYGTRNSLVTWFHGPPFV